MNAMIVNIWMSKKYSLSFCPSVRVENYKKKRESDNRTHALKVTAVRYLLIILFGIDDPPDFSLLRV
jgi:hypothetical protein